MSPSTNARRLLLGSCPDSWGVWFPDDPLQTPWSRFLDELADVGYQYLELGLYGYLPTDPGRLRDEVGKRGLTIAGGTVADFSGLHKRDEFSSILEATRQVAGLTAAVGPQHVIFVQVPGPSTPNSRNGSTASRKAAKPGPQLLGRLRSRRRRRCLHRGAGQRRLDRHFAP
jgi:sugar phosphate isomerase/epimerase